MTRHLFNPGQIVATSNLLNTISGFNPVPYLERHLSGDWGELDAEDNDTNNRALVEGSRLLSAYTHDGVKFWIITEADRSVTTFLLPEDY